MASWMASLIASLVVLAVRLVSSFPELLVASLAWGVASTMPSLSTQAAMTWVWAGDECAAWLQVRLAALHSHCSACHWDLSTVARGEMVLVLIFDWSL